MNLQDALKKAIFLVLAIDHNNQESGHMTASGLLCDLAKDEHHTLTNQSVRRLLVVIPGAGTLFDYAVFDVTWVSAIGPDTRPSHLIRFSHRRPTNSAYADESGHWILEEMA